MPVTQARRTRTQYRNQRLDRTSSTALDCIEGMLGIYSTAPTSHVGLAARVERYDPSMLDALVTERKVVRMAGVRGSGFVLPTSLVAMIACATRPGRERYFKDILDRMIDRKTYEDLARRIERLLSNAEMTAAEIRKQLDLLDPKQADALTYVLSGMTNECRIVVSGVRGTWRSNLPSYSRWEDMLPGIDPWGLDLDTARRELAKRYFETHGPATIEDFAWWSGFKGDARQVVGDAEIPRLEGGFFGGGKDVPPPRSVRLLPYWDSALLTHRDRTHVVGPEDYGSVYDASGNPCPTVLVNAKVRGVWDLTVDRSRALVKIAPLTAFADETWKKIATEAERLASVLSLSDLQLIRCKNPPSIEAGPRNLFMSPLRDH